MLQVPFPDSFALIHIPFAIVALTLELFHFDKTGWGLQPLVTYAHMAFSIYRV